MIQDGPTPFSQAINCARIPHTKPVYLIDHYGYINAFLIDDFEIMLRELGIKEKLLPFITDILHANLVYGFADKIGLMPGAFKQGDEAIIEHLRNHISYMIDGDLHQEVIDALLASWNRVAAHPRALAINQKRLLSYAELGTEFTPFFNYHFFFKHIFAGILNLWQESTPEHLKFYLNITEIMMSALENRAYRRNDFFNYDLLIRELTWYLKNSPSLAYVERIEQKLEEVKSVRDWTQQRCLTHIRGWCEQEILDLEKECKKPKELRQYEKSDLETALLNILKRSKHLSKKAALNAKLIDIFHFNANPYGKYKGLVKFVFTEDERAKMGEHEVRRYIHEAIERTIIEYAQDNHLNIYQTEFPLPGTLQCLQMPEDQVITALCEGSIDEPHQLYALYQTTKFISVKEIITSLVKDQGEYVQMLGSDVWRFSQQGVSRSGLPFTGLWPRGHQSAHFSLFAPYYMSTRSLSGQPASSSQLSSSSVGVLMMSPSVLPPLLGSSLPNLSNHSSQMSSHASSEQLSISSVDRINSMILFQRPSNQLIEQETDNDSSSQVEHLSDQLSAVSIHDEQPSPASSSQSKPAFVPGYRALQALISGNAFALPFTQNDQSMEGAIQRLLNLKKKPPAEHHAADRSASGIGCVIC